MFNADIVSADEVRKSGSKTTLPMLMFIVLVSGRILSRQRNITSKVKKRTYEDTVSDDRRKY